MALIKHLKIILSLLTGVLMSQVYAQPANLILQDTTIATAATFTASNSITAGPNCTITASGDATFVTGGNIYFRPEIVIIQGGQLRTIGDSTLVGINIPEVPTIPTEFTLQQNYPNPFNPTTTIRFGLPQASRVRIELFNITGQRVAVLLDERKEAGYQLLQFDAGQLASGVYFYRLISENFSDVKKMVLMR